MCYFFVRKEQFADNNSNLLFFHDTKLPLTAPKIAIDSLKIAINNIQIAINVNGNLYDVNGNLGPGNGNLGTMKRQQSAVIIVKVLFYAKNCNLLFFSIKCLCVLSNRLDI